MYPALAVVAALGERADVLWLGGEGGIEERLVRREGLPFRAIPAAGLHGVGLTSIPGNLITLLRGTLAARLELDQFEPDVLFFTGGYVGGPVALAGLRLPKVAYVPDIEPALALRWIGRVSDRICVTAPESSAHYRDESKLRVTGYPSRFAGQAPDRRSGRLELGLTADPPVVLVLGGSKGARSINQALWEGLPELLERAQVVHLTGERDWPLAEPARDRLPEDQAGRYKIHPYLHEEMGHALAAADLVVSRAGASILGDYPLFGLPSVLVPYPHAWRYQRTNASYLAARGAAVVLEDEELEAELIPTVLELLEDESRRSKMGVAATALAQPDAARAIADEIVAVQKERTA